MFKVLKFLVALLIIGNLLSCVNENVVRTVKLTSCVKIPKLADSIYLSSQIPCIDYVNKHIYVSDYKQALYVLDDKCNLINIASHKGNGFGEVQCPTFIYAAPDAKISLFDECKRKFMYYKDEQYYSIDLESISSERLSTLCRFFTIGDTIYHSIINDINTVVKIVNGKVVSKQCKLVDSMDDTRRPIKSQRHLLRGDNTMFIIGKGLPILQEYTFDGKLLNSYDLLADENLATVYDIKDPKEFNRYNIIVRDAYYKKGYIYILTSSHENDRYRCNTIYVLQRYENNYIPVVKYRLNGNIYSTFCITDDNRCIAVNDKNSSIEIYNLSNSGNE